MNKCLLGRKSPLLPAFTPQKGLSTSAIEGNRCDLNSCFLTYLNDLYFSCLRAKPWMSEGWPWGHWSPWPMQGIRLVPLYGFSLFVSTKGILGALEQAWGGAIYTHPLTRNVGLECRDCKHFTLAWNINPQPGGVHAKPTGTRPGRSGCYRGNDMAPDACPQAAHFSPTPLTLPHPFLLPLAPTPKDNTRCCLAPRPQRPQAWCSRHI